MKKIVLIDTTPDIAVAFACVATCHHGEVLMVTTQAKEKDNTGPCSTVQYGTVRETERSHGIEIQERTELFETPLLVTRNSRASQLSQNLKTGPSFQIHFSLAFDFMKPVLSASCGISAMICNSSQRVRVYCFLRPLPSQTHIALSDSLSDIINDTV